ncbi:MAG: cation-transporting P-type ATPase [Micavibrio sp.]|nr:cation-transporting P-type ATPase [Micavibrio sp.]
MKSDAVKTIPLHPAAFWTQNAEALCATLQCGTGGLTAEEAGHRLAEYGANSDTEAKRDSFTRAVLRRVLEPLSLILLVAGIVSLATGDVTGGVIIIAILTLSIGLDTVQEGHAVKAAEVLRRSVALKAEVRRDGSFRQSMSAEVVPGDMLRVRAGDIVAG